MATRKPARRSRPTTAASRKLQRGRRSTKAKASASRGKAAKTGKTPAKPATASRRASKPARKARRASSPAVARKKPVRKTARTKAPAKPPVKVVAPRPAPAKTRTAATRPATRPVVRPALDRERRRLTEIEREPSTTEAEVRARSAARSGHDELRSELERHNETSPVLTAGDVDAKWEDAYAVGDEAPGGDNPTPDQDRVDDIGKALGVTYEDAEELRGSDKITDRDLHRWELDPASADDWPHTPGKK